jgi:hypothetical protein
MAGTNLQQPYCFVKNESDDGISDVQPRSNVGCYNGSHKYQLRRDEGQTGGHMKESWRP